MEAEIDRWVQVRMAICELFNEEIDLTAWTSSLFVELTHLLFLHLERAATYVSGILPVKARFVCRGLFRLGERLVKVAFEIIEVFNTD